jgi:hypothetical protein
MKYTDTKIGIRLGHGDRTFTWLLSKQEFEELFSDDNFMGYIVQGIMHHRKCSLDEALEHKFLGFEGIEE